MLAPSLFCARSVPAAAVLALPSEPSSEREAARDLLPVSQPPPKEAYRPGTPWCIIYPVLFDVGLVHTCMAADVHLRFQVQACPSPLGTCEVRKMCNLSCVLKNFLGMNLEEFSFC